MQLQKNNNNKIKKYHIFQWKNVKSHTTHQKASTIYSLSFAIQLFFEKYSLLSKRTAHEWNIVKNSTENAKAEERRSLKQQQQQQQQSTENK